MFPYRMRSEQAGGRDRRPTFRDISQLCVRGTWILQVVAIPLFFACFEAAKEFVAQGLTKWQSHLLSIGMVAIISVIVVSIAQMHLARSQCQGRRAEEALQQQRQFLQTVIDSVGDGIITCDAGGTLTLFNRALRDLHGFSQDTLSPEDWMEARRQLYRPDGKTPLPLEETPLIRIRRGEQFDNVEIVIIPRQGPQRTVLITGRALVGKDGQPQGAVAGIHDITDRKRAEQKQARLLQRLEGMNRLQEELLAPGTLEEKFKKITDTAVRLLDLDFCRIWRVKPGDHCHSGCAHALAKEEGRVCHHHDKCLHLIASSGRYTHTNGTHGRMPLGCYKIGYIASGDNKNFVTNSVITDPLVGDHAWAMRLGLVSFVGHRLHDAAGKTAGVMAMFAKHPVEDEDAAFLSHLVETASKVIIDHQSEEELRHAQKMEAVGLLAGGMAHEFNNLLQAISGYVRFAMKGLPPQEQRYDDLQEACKAADRAATLTRHLLGFSRRSALQPKSVNPNDVVAELVKMLRPVIGEQILLEVTCDADPGTVWADAGQLQQALLNLCLNAGRHARRRQAPAEDGARGVGRHVLGRRFSHRAGTLRRFHGGRHRLRHVAGGAAADLRAVLYHQGRRPRDGTRASHGLWHGAPTQGSHPRLQRVG